MHTALLILDIYFLFKRESVCMWEYVWLSYHIDGINTVLIVQMSSYFYCRYFPRGSVQNHGGSSTKFVCVCVCVCVCV